MNCLIRQYCNDRFPLRAKAERVREFRKRAQISMATIFLWLVG